MAVQRALVAALAPVVPVYDGPPRGAPYPHAAISGGAATDWSTKDAVGRELRLALAIWDDGAVPARLHALMAQAEAAIEGIARDLDGHRVASVVLLRSLIVRDADGPWAGRLDYRVRVLATG